MAVPITRFLYGDTVQYQPSADTAAGIVVDLGGFFGITVAPIKAGVVGALAITGEFTVAKSGSSGPIFTTGDLVYFNRTTLLASKGGLDCVPIGPCTLAAATTDTSVRCMLMPHAHPIHYGKIFKDTTLAGGDYTVIQADGANVLNVTVGHATNAILLPAIATSGNLGWDIVVRCAYTAGALLLIVKPNGTDIISLAGTVGSAGKQLWMAAGSAKLGDFVRLSGTSAGWCVTAMQGAWTKQP